jgi:hypothetical protein
VSVVILDYHIILHTGLIHPSPLLKVESVPRRQRITLLALMDVFRGMKHKKIQSEEWDHLALYGSGSKLSKLDVERLIRHLIVLNVLAEETVYQNGFPSNYAKVGVYIYMRGGFWNLGSVCADSI